MLFVGSCTRSDSTAKNVFLLPPGAIPYAVSMYSPTAVATATTATVSVGKTGSATYFVNAQDVKGESGQMPCAAAANLGVAVSATASTQVIMTYAETGSTGTAGNLFWVFMWCYLV